MPRCRKKFGLPTNKKANLFVQHLRTCVGRIHLRIDISIRVCETSIADLSFYDTSTADFVFPLFVRRRWEKIHRLFWQWDSYVIQLLSKWLRRHFLSLQCLKTCVRRSCLQIDINIRVYETYIADFVFHETSIADFVIPLFVRLWEKMHRSFRHSHCCVIHHRRFRDKTIKQPKRNLHSHFHGIHRRFCDGSLQRTSQFTQQFSWTNNIPWTKIYKSKSESHSTGKR